MRTFFILAIFILGCAKEKPIPREKLLNGWAGSPNNPQSKPFDYFYMKSVGRASVKALGKKDNSLMKKTCINAATSTVKGDLVYMLVRIARVCESLSCDYFLNKESKLDLMNISVASCTGIEDPFPWYFQTQLSKNIKIQDTDCKPLYANGENESARFTRIYPEVENPFGNSASNSRENFAI